MKKQRSAPKGKPIQIFLSTRISSTSANIYYPNTTLKEPAFNCLFVHKGSVLPQYSYWITPVLLLDYSSTCIGYGSSTCIGILYLFRSCLAQLTKIFSYLLAVIQFLHQLISKVSCLLYLQGFSFAG